MPRLTSCASAILLVMVAACSSTPVSQPSAGVAPQGSAPAAAAPAPARPPATATPAPPTDARLAHLDPGSAIARERSVYFEYDAVEIAPQYRPLLERHGQYLRTHPALKVIIEGNADERGGAEYNLALGQRRSESVKSALRLLGATEAQLEAISFGEEKPVASGHDEPSWQRNRRADIVYAR